MTIDLAFDDTQQAIAASVAQFCRGRCPPEVSNEIVGFPTELWAELAELGVLALATPEGDGNAVEMVAACEALGGAVFPGPLAHTFLATQLLPEAERVAVASGRAVVSVGAPPLMPWAPAAGIFIELEGERAWRATPRGAIEPVQTLAGEPWGRVALARGAELFDAPRGLALYAIALAAYLVAAARQLVAETTEHARTRVQFGHAIGEFQAVAHPLADCDIRLAAAEILAREAAFRFDAAAPGEPMPAAVRSRAGAARLAACAAAIDAAHVCHQLFGAMGITLEGPVFRFSRRIRQLVSQLPGDGAARAAVLGRFGL